MSEIVLKPNEWDILSCLNAIPKKNNALIKCVNDLNNPLKQARHELEHLRAIGYIKMKGKGFYFKTPVGFEAEKRRKLPVGLPYKNEKLIKVVNLFPTLGHRYIFWFWLAGILFKKYLLFGREEFKNYNPSFIVLGGTGEMKTIIGETLIKALRLPRQEHLIQVANVTRAEVLGRRQSIGKSEAGIEEFRINPAPYWGRSLILFDEAGEARDRATFDAIMFYLNGERKFENEQTEITALQTACVCMNPVSKWLIPDPYQRRAFVLDTRVFGLDPQNTTGLGRKIAHSYIPPINIDGLRADIDYLPDKDLKFLEDLLFEGVKDIKEAKIKVCPPAVEKIILGWLIATGTHDIRDASYWAATGALTFLETQEATKEGWWPVLRKKWGKYKGSRDKRYEAKWVAEAQEEKERDRERKKKWVERDAEEDELLNKRNVFDDEVKEQLDKLKDSVNDSKEAPGFANRRAGLSKEYIGFKKGHYTEERLAQLKRRVEYWTGQLQPYIQTHKQELINIKRAKQHAKEKAQRVRQLRANLNFFANQLGRKKKGEKARLRRAIRKALKDPQAHNESQLEDWLRQAKAMKEKIDQSINKPTIEELPADPIGDAVNKAVGFTDWLTKKEIPSWWEKLRNPGPMKKNVPEAEIKEEESQEAVPPTEKPKTSKYFISPGDYLKSIISPTIPKKKEKEDVQDEDGSSWWRPK